MIPAESVPLAVSVAATVVKNGSIGGSVVIFASYTASVVGIVLRGDSVVLIGSIGDFVVCIASMDWSVVLSDVFVVGSESFGTFVVGSAGRSIMKIYF